MSETEQEDVSIDLPKVKDSSSVGAESLVDSEKKLRETEDDKNTLIDVKRVVKETKVAGGMKCIGILPGLGSYQHSSDSEASSDSDEEIEQTKYDLLGRKIKTSKDKEKS